MEGRPVIVWFRRDLRIADNPALFAAAKTGRPIIPLFVWSPDDEGDWTPGAASRWWLHHSLETLHSRLIELGLKLVLRRGRAAEALSAVVNESQANAVYWNRLYEPALVRRDTEFKEALQHKGVEAHSFNGSLLFEPWQLQNTSKKPFQVFGAYNRALKSRAREIEDSPPVPKKVLSAQPELDSNTLEDLNLLQDMNGASRFQEFWEPGEPGAQLKLKQFLKTGLDGYEAGRDLPGFKGTSLLSPHLHFGEISVRAVRHAVLARAEAKKNPPPQSDVDAYTDQLSWREFAHHLLFFFPESPAVPLRAEFSRFPWAADPQKLRAWQQGQTGYPIVDAGMRQLLMHGWMHNRVRMITASFLVKDLLIPWQEGERWYWNCLVDADLANNALGWQWVAGCGADAAPFFRIFNPVLQGQKFDPEGSYVRNYIPELVKLPDKWIHQPWKAPPEVLGAADVELGKSYPRPIVDHDEARDYALEAFEEIKLGKKV